MTRLQASAGRAAAFVRTLALLLVVGACSRSAAPSWSRADTPLEPASIDDSMICQGLANSFIGLPALAEASPGDPISSTAGRWWIRSCAARTRGASLEVELQGPGWYWIEQMFAGVGIRQQVPFDLHLLVVGRLHEEITDGVLSLWLEPTSEPEVHVDSPPRLAVRTVNVSGAVLKHLPGLSLEERAAQRFNAGLIDGFRDRLKAGATLTYQLRAGQVDAALGRLGPGKTPAREFPEESKWLLNERLLLPVGASQVLGPLKPGTIDLNVIMERGAGVDYRIMCERAVEKYYWALASGNLSKVPPSDWSFSDSASGLGERTQRLRVDGCNFYLVVASTNNSDALISLVVR